MISDSGKPEQEWQEEFANTVYEPGSEVEKILVRKIDTHIVRCFLCRELMSSF